MSERPSQGLTALPPADRTGELVRLEGVVVREGGRAILEVDRLEVREGEILAVLGPTGAGKSTLLRVMSLLRRPDAGSVLWRGQPVAFPPPVALRRRITMAFQSPLLFSGTVLDNVAYGLRVRGERGDGARQRVDEMLRLFGIADLAERPANLLSGGEAHRTALARALVVRPELLLLDEPLASLDPPIKERLLEELLAIIRGSGLTCVIVTHDQAEAWAAADRVVVIGAGRVAQTGTRDDVFARPGSAFVAGFVGTTNTLRGRVVTCAGGLATIEIEGRHLLAAVDGAPDGEVLACVRPENVVLSRGGTGGGAVASLPARVRALFDRQATVSVSLDCGFPLVALLTRQAARGLMLSPGDEVVASIAATSVHLIPHPEP